MDGNSVIGCIDLERIETFVADVFDRPEPIPKSFSQDNIRLPEVIFGLKDGRIDLTLWDDYPLFGVPMSVFLKDCGDLAYRDKTDLISSLKLPLNAKVVLIGTSSDEKQQAIWKASEKREIWKRIAEFGFEWATSTSFSVWDQNPRSDQVIFQRRNYLVSDILANLGLPVIPFIYPFDDCDYRNFASWINLRPDIRIVAVMATFYKTDTHFNQLIQNMHKIQDSAKRDLQFLIVGAGTQSKIAKALTHFQNCSFVVTTPYSQAVAGENLQRVKHLEIPKSEVWFNNYKTFMGMIENLKNNLPWDRDFGSAI